MLTIKRSVAIIAILFSPLSTTSNLTLQLHNFFSTQLAGVGDGVRVSIRTTPNLLPSCEQPLLSMGNNSRLWGNMNVLARCGNGKRYLQVNVQTIGDCVVAAMPIVREEELETGNVEPKCGRLDTPPPRTVLDVNQLADAISLRNLPSDQPTQSVRFHQVWRVKMGQHVNVIASGGGFNANAEGQVLSNAVVTQNARVHVVSGQVVNGVVDAGEDVLIDL